MTKRMGSNIFLEEEKIKIDDGLNDFTRRTYMIRKKYIDLIDRKAYWERRNKQDILDEILEQYFKDKEIKQFPK